MTRCAEAASEGTTSPPKRHRVEFRRIRAPEAFSSVSSESGKEPSTVTGVPPSLGPPAGVSERSAGSG